MIEMGRRNREPIEEEERNMEENGELSRNANRRNHQQQEGYGGNSKHNPMVCEGQWKLENVKNQNLQKGKLWHTTN
jgi:hypothetical protein